MASQILTPYDVTGGNRPPRARAGVKRDLAPAPRMTKTQPSAVRRDLPALLVTALVAVSAAVATSAWMVQSIHLF
jgi:hypothetical protein